MGDPSAKRVKNQGSGYLGKYCILDEDEVDVDVACRGAGEQGSNDKLCFTGGGPVCLVVSGADPEHASFDADGWVMGLGIPANLRVSVNIARRRLEPPADMYGVP